MSQMERRISTVSLLGLEYSIGGEPVGDDEQPDASDLAGGVVDVKSHVVRVRGLLQLLVVGPVATALPHPVEPAIAVATSVRVTDAGGTSPR